MLNEADAGPWRVVGHLEEDPRTDFSTLSPELERKTVEEQFEKSRDRKVTVRSGYTLAGCESLARELLNEPILGFEVTWP